MNGYQITSKLINISESKLGKSLLTLSDKSLARLSPSALASRAKGKVPIYVGGPKQKLFGVSHPLVQPSLSDHLKTIVRGDLKNQPVDKLAQKKPGTIQRLSNISPFWESPKTAKPAIPKIQKAKQVPSFNGFNDNPDDLKI